MKIHYTLSLLLIFFSALSCAQSQRNMQTITPHSRPADELLPIIQAYIKPPSSVRLYHNSLILNATSSEHQQITFLLDQLDKPATDLLFSLKTQAKTGTTQQQNTVKKAAHSNTVTLTSKQTSQLLGQQGEQQIRASEGQAAYIQIAQQDFYVIARLNGDQVHIQLNQSGHRSSLQLHTQTTGKLGQWILIGQLQQQGAQQQQEILARKNNNSGENSAIYIKVSTL